MMPPIETNGLIKRYGNKAALNCLTLTINDRKIIGLIGRNGAGKTTFLKSCAGLLRPTAGEIRVWGERPFDNPRVLSQLVFVGEETQYDAGLKLKEIMELGAIYYPNWDQAFSGRILKLFELDPAMKYKSLSLGMKTQFKVLIGLSSRTPLVLLDEPTLGMDAAMRKVFYHVLISDYSVNPRTIIISSHLPDEVEQLIEEVIILKDGKLVFQQPITESQQYAIGLHGRREELDVIIKNKQLLYHENFGKNASVVIVNDLEPEELMKLKTQNVQSYKVSFQDLCIYLTQREKEGLLDENAI